MSDQFTIYQPNPMAYVGFGISEGLRKHMEFMQHQKADAERNNQFQQELAFRRNSAETEAIQRANELALREKQFNEASAKDQSRLDFEQEKFKEDKRQWEAESPIRMQYLKDLGSARETTAGAAVTRAKAFVTGKSKSGKDVFTPGGLGKVYSDLWVKNFTEIARTYSKDFTNIYSDEKLYNKVSDQATEATRKAATPYLNSYNDYVGSNPTAVGMPQMSWDDLEALPQVAARKKANPVDVTAAKDWNALQNDKTFSSRFETLAVTDNELDLLRINAPDLYTVYKDKLKNQGSDQLKNKMHEDRIDELNRIRVNKNADKQ